ncbi:hypothetical protein BIFGAL_04318 [Bifidobacterium gallicum DSM 20093 = LMG 11596]|uniref:Signal recognition particle-docking protein FtsY n=1 Tax=Bifidobacterium gallicum DSM 20093 = LMG 11596 TaxID=561180 RepID=D1NWR1_9BIFI|nr:hypothetical protein BIFGAL_04318 [Bifidobacterium gallicum DSM 20093 = LMG 11596]KFI59047.1 signal recognition particle-docking protein FtsY [Bifidobacterium gallicum DSM 20093 = LMG 11596]
MRTQHIWRVARRAIASLVTACAAVGVSMIGAANAWAVQQVYPNYMESRPIVIDGTSHMIGRLAVDDDGEAYYCISFEDKADFKLVSSTTAPDTDEARQVGWLLAQYSRTTGAQMLHSALAIIIHDVFDTSTNPNSWVDLRSMVATAIPSSFTKVDEVLQEAQANVLDHASIDVQFNQETHQGRVIVDVYTKTGQRPASGKFTVKLSGPARWVGESEQNAVEADATKQLTLEWEATGDGEVSFAVEGLQYSVLLFESKQNFARRGEPYYVLMKEATAAVNGPVVAEPEPGDKPEPQPEPGDEGEPGGEPEPEPQPEPGDEPDIDKEPDVENGPDESDRSDVDEVGNTAPITTQTKSSEQVRSEQSAQPQADAEQSAQPLAQTGSGIVEVLWLLAILVATGASLMALAGFHVRDQKG